jgi:hypothetical protein
MRHRAQRRKPWPFRVLALSVGVALTAAACATTPASSTNTSSATAAAGTTIPQSSVSFGWYPCCADSAFVAVALQKGFFKSVGINITPSGGYSFTNPNQVNPAMERGQFDFATQYMPAALPTLSSYGQKVPPAMYVDNYVGYAFIAPPNSPLKTVVQFMKEGYSFTKAAGLAVAQLKGQVVYTDPFSGAQPPEPAMFFLYDKYPYNVVKWLYLDDAKTLALASSGRVKLWFPQSGPEMSAALLSGWKEVIDTQEILQYAAPSSNYYKYAVSLLGGNGMMGQRSFIDSNYDTTLRFESAIFRALSYCTTPSTEQSCWSITARAIDVTQGLTLSAADIGGIIRNVDPFYPFSAQASAFWSPKSYLYAPALLKTQMQSLIANGTLPKGSYNLTTYIAPAVSLYNSLTSLKAEATKLFAKAGSGNAKLVARARQYYNWFDYLDAVRLLKAATGSS